MAMQRDDVDSTSVGLTKLAKEAHADCNGDRDAAVALLWSWLDDDPALYERLVRPMIEDQLYDAVGKVDRDLRQHLRAVTPDNDEPPAPALVTASPTPFMPSAPALAVVPRPQPNPDRGITGAELNALDSLLDWPLFGGRVRLGDATPAELQQEIQRIGKVERTYRADRRFLELVYEKMHGGTCVRNVLSDAALRRLQQQAKEE